MVLAFAYLAASIFSFIVSKKYWSSRRIFGKTYFSLGIAYFLNFAGNIFFPYLQMYHGVTNPFPHYPDIIFLAFYPFALYHVVKNTWYFNRGKFQRKHILLLVAIPIAVTSFYAFSILVEISIPDSVPDLLSRQFTIGETSFTVAETSPNSNYQKIIVGNVTYDLIPFNIKKSHYPQIYDPEKRFNLVPIIFENEKFVLVKNPDQKFWNMFYVAVAYVAATSVTFSWAIIATQFFRNSILGIPWGLLLVAIILNSIGDTFYHYHALYVFDRSNPSIAGWIFGAIIACYALYLHKKYV